MRRRTTWKRKAISTVLANVIMIALVLSLGATLIAWADASYGIFASAQQAIFHQKAQAAQERFTIENVFFNANQTSVTAFVRNTGLLEIRVVAVYINGTYLYPTGSGGTCTFSGQPPGAVIPVNGVCGFNLNWGRTWQDGTEFYIVVATARGNQQFYRGSALGPPVFVTRVFNATTYSTSFITTNTTICTTLAVTTSYTTVGCNPVTITVTSTGFVITSTTTKSTSTTSVTYKSSLTTSTLTTATRITTTTTTTSYYKSTNYVTTTITTSYLTSPSTITSIITVTTTSFGTTQSTTTSVTTITTTSTAILAQPKLIMPASPAQVVELRITVFFTVPTSSTSTVSGTTSVTIITTTSSTLSTTTITTTTTAPQLSTTLSTSLKTYISTYPTTITSTRTTTTSKSIIVITSTTTTVTKTMSTIPTTYTSISKPVTSTTTQSTSTFTTIQPLVSTVCSTYFTSSTSASTSMTTSQTTQGPSGPFFSISGFRLDWTGVFSFLILGCSLAALGGLRETACSSDDDEVQTLSMKSEGAI